MSMSTTTNSSVHFILISLYFSAIGIFFNLVYKIGITSVFSVEIHDFISQMQNKSQPFLLDSFMYPEV